MKTSFRYPSPTSHPTLLPLHKTSNSTNMAIVITASILGAMVVAVCVLVVVWKLYGGGDYKSSRDGSYNVKKVVVIPVSPRTFPDEYGTRDYHSLPGPQVNIYRPQEYIL